jgi:hypothetical protein
MQHNIEKLRQNLKESNIELVYQVTGVHPHTLRRIRDSKTERINIYEPTFKKLEVYFDAK